MNFPSRNYMRARSSNLSGVYPLSPRDKDCTSHKVGTFISIIYLERDEWVNEISSPKHEKRILMGNNDFLKSTLFYKVDIRGKDW